MAERVKAEEILTLGKCKLFFDANIWMFIYFPIGNAKKEVVNVYSNIYSRIVTSDIEIYTDIMILSEVINRYLRLQFHIYNDSAYQKLPFKQYRELDEYREHLEYIYTNVVKRQILKVARVTDCSYTKENLYELLNINNTSLDFNDAHLVHQCKTNKFYLLTDDGDFKNEDIKIVSHNREYFSGK